MKSSKEIFFAWSQNADINCYKKMLDYAPNYKIQFVWLIILLGSTLATFYFIAKSILDFWSFSVVSQTNLINDVPSQFPAVTFCDNNPFSSFESQLFMNKVAETNGISINDSINLMSTSLYHASYLSDEKRQRLGLSIEQIKCMYINTDCKHDLHWYWSWEYGNCFQFNSGLNLTNQKIEIKKSIRNGKDFGLNVTLFLFNKNKYFSSFENGLVVFVHNSSFRPSQRVFIEPGKMTSIQVERTFIQKQPQPYSDCIDLTTYSSELYDYISKIGQAYRQQDCFDLCLQKLLIKECKCYFPGIQNLNTYLRPCLNLTDFECINQQYFNFNLNECQQNYCPLECDSIKYGLMMSSLVYPSQTLFDLFLSTDDSIRDLFESSLNQSFNIDLYKSYAVSFKVFYPSLQYTLFTETPKMTLADLFSQIGGALGLFVSFSIFTLFEFIELFVLLIYGLLHSRKQNIYALPTRLRLFSRN